MALSCAVPRQPATAFAALIVVALPVVALLGVVLESPFGAIPYFWAVGHLAHEEMARTTTTRLPVIPARARLPSDSEGRRAGVGGSPVDPDEPTGQLVLEQPAGPRRP